ncbi:hypothetical protein LOZ33_003780 [Ophidiomyces ophidiicola]|uniref:Uncharacterized protein n=1 Tax=Ophidiomyces ophidiicola TaxID=1387563 RepID=A0ACB8URX6_9EURO|nr:hypothetical protein LOZ49_003549 [Ophidiomyces ophidiicola]KAI2013961.1 hypothetical protein LOZ46_005666 [Ophidiomyces ophidiicola]KAI2096343.1 hypothetical protein LOZ33_003780 [Ophidiomyces ophidiicola]KAI2213573.1 hypothetical protein LOZ15_005074 [Ophidiomyces ophidiicola]KAI2266414.1 hypothetical protein LOZ10_001882 [Ophidiomyces ophidiicola]
MLTSEHCLSVTSAHSELLIDMIIFSNSDLIKYKESDETSEAEQTADHESSDSDSPDLNIIVSELKKKNDLRLLSIQISFNSFVSSLFDESFFQTELQFLKDALQHLLKLSEHLSEHKKIDIVFQLL